MGGCATKPKVSKEDDQAKAKAPEPQPEPELQHPNQDTVETKLSAQEQGGDNLNLDEIVDDDQGIKRRSLSFLFKENEDTKVSTETVKTVVEETVKQETEIEKPSEGTKSNDPTVKQESPKPEEKPTVESISNESEKQESPVVNVTESETAKTDTPQTENPSEESHITEPAQETQRTESETEKTSEENNQSNEPLKEEQVETNETSSEETQSNEPIKLEPIEPSEKKDSKAEKSETPIEESINTEAVPLPEEKVIEVVLTDAESVEKVTDEAKSTIEEKSHIGVEDAPKAEI